MPVRVRIQFFSFYRDLAGCAETEMTVADGSSLAELLAVVYGQYSKLSPMAKSTLVAVGLEYQDRGYRLREGDVVSLFPPVQGG